jgi:hypothetical protein
VTELEADEGGRFEALQGCFYWAFIHRPFGGGASPGWMIVCTALAFALAIAMPRLVASRAHTQVVSLLRALPADTAAVASASWGDLAARAAPEARDALEAIARTGEHGRHRFLLLQPAEGAPAVAALALASGQFDSFLLLRGEVWRRRGEPPGLQPGDPAPAVGALLVEGVSRPCCTPLYARRRRCRRSLPPHRKVADRGPTPAALHGLAPAEPRASARDQDLFDTLVSERSHGRSG